ncbi:MAG: hypothetical protein WC521_02860 [Bdellovibrionales bacterium]
MKLIADIKNPQSLRFIIQHDSRAGYYLYMFMGDFCIRDHLQDTFAIAVNQASRDYNVPPETWKQTDSEPTKWNSEPIRQEPIIYSIESAPQDTFSILIYQNDRILYNREQKNLDKAKSFMLEKFHIPLTAWKQIE